MSAEQYGYLQRLDLNCKERDRMPVVLSGTTPTKTTTTRSPQYIGGFGGFAALGTTTTGSGTATAAAAADVCTDGVWRIRALLKLIRFGLMPEWTHRLRLNELLEVESASAAKPVEELPACSELATRAERVTNDDYYGTKRSK